MGYWPDEKVWRSARLELESVDWQMLSSELAADAVVTGAELAAQSTRRGRPERLARG